MRLRKIVGGAMAIASGASCASGIALAVSKPHMAHQGLALAVCSLIVVGFVLAVWGGYLICKPEAAAS